MAYNFSPEVARYLNDYTPVPAATYSWAGDPGFNSANSLINQAAVQGQRRENIEWANQQRMMDPAYWAQAFGMNSQQKLSDLSGFDITQSPSYKWRFDQGMEAVNRNMAAKGLLKSGNRLAELTKYGQGMASQEYDNEFNRRLAQQKLANDMRAQNMSMAMQGMQAMKRYMPPGEFQTPAGFVTRWD